MWLLIDIGNTRIKWRFAQGEILCQGGAELLPGAGEESSLFSRIWGAAERPSDVFVSCVGPLRVREALSAWLEESWQCTPQFVASAARQCGVTNGYEEHDRLGVDRWCTLIGAHALAPGQLGVVDCGTAITLDMLAEDGRHQGGIIAPGLSTMIQALKGTALGDRADVSLTPFFSVLGRNTAECIRAGVLSAAAGLVEHTLDRLQFPKEAPLLLTGGDAALLNSALKLRARVEPDLVFKGLARIALEGALA